MLASLLIYLAPLDLVSTTLLMQETLTPQMVSTKAIPSSELNNETDWNSLKSLGRANSKYLKKTTEVPSSRKPVADIKGFEKRIKSILKKNCVGCHGPDTQEANLRIDTLDPDLLTGKDVDWWLEVFAVVGNGEMPPPDEVEISETDRTLLIDWLTKEIQLASTNRREKGNHSSFRRMTRYEFNYALQDLLNIERDFARDLPPDAISEDGFENSSEMLHMSVNQLEVYRRIALQALKRATALGDRPQTLYWGISMEQAGRIDWQKLKAPIEKAKNKLAEDKPKFDAEIAKLEERMKQIPQKTYYHRLSNDRKATATWSYPQARYAQSPSKTPQTPPTGVDVVAILKPGRHQRLTLELGNQLPDHGIMKVRVKATRVSTTPNQIPSLQLHFGWQASNEGRAVMQVSKSDHRIAATVDKPEFYEWEIPLGDIYPRNSVRKKSPMGVTPSPSEYIRLINSSVTGGDIRIEYVEVIAPYLKQWPPQSHQLIFESNEESADNLSYARNVIVRFMRRAWRRQIETAEVDRKLKLLKQIRPHCKSEEEAIIEVLASVLASPNFLYVVQNPGGAKVSVQRNATGSVVNDESAERTQPDRLNDFELATRLSFFLWCSIPDDELIRLAEQGELSKPEILEQQVSRMLQHPKGHRLANHFVDQWLDLQLLAFLDFKPNFRGFDPLLKSAMQEEPRVFFHQLLTKNLSVLNFLHSDFAMVNERLARHYGIPGVTGNGFRQVPLQKQRKRGGLLTQAGILAMNADGQDSHPLKRGIWLLESILNDPPPPPPPAVPEIDLADPAIAKMTLKERIEDHRNHAACRSCHSKIDPWGIAFENYDALGRYREQVKGKPVDASSRLFNKEELVGMDGLKKYLLLNRQDQFVRAMVFKMATFALGRPLTFADRTEIDKITKAVRQKEDGLSTLVQQLVTSDLFHNR